MTSHDKQVRVWVAVNKFRGRIEFPQIAIDGGSRSEHGSPWLAFRLSSCNGHRETKNIDELSIRGRGCPCAHDTGSCVCAFTHRSYISLPTMASSQVPGILTTIRFAWSQLDEVEIRHVSQVPMQFTLYINGHRISTVVASSTAVPSHFPTGLLTSSF
jgi:hypothetical protein